MFKRYSSRRKRLLHGKANGEIIIKNESPHISGGVHTVVDRVRKSRRGGKVSEEIIENHHR